jgi:hypothetical protein
MSVRLPGDRRVPVEVARRAELLDEVDVDREALALVRRHDDVLGRTPIVATCCSASASASRSTGTLAVPNMIAALDEVGVEQVHGRASR